MKRRDFLFGAGVSLLLPSLALAQPNMNGRPDNRPGGPGNRPGGPGDNRPGGPGDNRPGRPGGPGNRPGGPGDNRPGRPGMRPPPRPQFSWRGRAYDRRPGPAFFYPRGYAYRRWAVGAVLPGLFLSTAYFFDDWRGLGIDRPPPGRRWVRYGPDLVLVNQRTRRIEDVIPDVFY